MYGTVRLIVGYFSHFTTELQQRVKELSLKNTHPKLRYMVQTDVSPPWFVIYGSNLKFLHWSYKRHLERVVRENFDLVGTAIKFSFRDEKQIKANREKATQAAEKAEKAATESSEEE